MSKYGVLISAIILFITNGYAMPGNSSYNTTGPQIMKVQNEKTVRKDFDSVWSELVENISSSFFIINKIEKESGKINVSFSTNTPEKYIDCGRTTITFERADEKNVYNYEIAEDSVYKYAIDNTRQYEKFATVAMMARNTDLEGHFNIFVSDQNNNTLIRTNGGYIFTVDVTGYVFTINDTGETVATDTYDQVIDGAGIPENNSVINFSTNSPNLPDKGGTVCNSKGILEKAILDFV